MVGEFRGPPDTLLGGVGAPQQGVRMQALLVDWGKVVIKGLAP